MQRPAPHAKDEGSEQGFWGTPFANSFSCFRGTPFVRNPIREFLSRLCEIPQNIPDFSTRCRKRAQLRSMRLAKNRAERTVAMALAAKTGKPTEATSASEGRGNDAKNGHNWMRLLRISWRVELRVGNIRSMLVGEGLGGWAHKHALKRFQSQQLALTYHSPVRTAEIRPMFGTCPAAMWTGGPRGRQGRRNSWRDAHAKKSPFPKHPANAWVVWVLLGDIPTPWRA